MAVIILWGNPAACRGHKTDLPAQAGGGSPVESRSISPQGGRSGSSSLWSTSGVKPRGRYNLISVLGQCLTVEDRAHPDKSDEMGDLHWEDVWELSEYIRSKETTLFYNKCIYFFNKFYINFNIYLK